MKQSDFILPELLSPAGNFEKLKFALRFGADAVYLAGKKFGMRASSDNFNLEELSTAVEYAHNFKKKVYLTLNVMPRQDDLLELESYLEEIAQIPLDGVIVADLGVFSICQKKAPNIPLHISTQAATVNALSCLKWYEMGAKRIVLARELSLREISNIRKNIPDDLELETFVHGSMCVSFSGRCMLSEYYTGRDANRGECTQPCRWHYRFYEEKRPDDILSCEIHPEGSYLFGSKDLSMINHVNELIQAGINSFKIEGRMKSAYYAAVTANAYRIALDSVIGKTDIMNTEALQRELESVSHREYCTGYFFDSKMQISQFASNSGYIGNGSFLCTVEEIDEKSGLARCRQKNKFTKNDACELLSPGKTGESIHILEMIDENGHLLESCPHPQMTFFMKTDKILHPGDVIRKML